MTLALSLNGSVICSPLHPRKIVSRQICWLILLTIITLGASLQAAEPVDPFVGNWLWNQDRTVTILADGTAHWEKSEGTWQYLHNPEVQRHYRIVWEHGKYVDEIACSEDGQRAHVRNLNGEQYNVRRALDDKPAVAPAPAAPRLATSAPTSPKPPAPAVTKDAADPIVGEWNWLKGMAATFSADGTVKSAAGRNGTWEFLHNPEPERKYHVTLRPGKYTSELLYDPAAGTARATNTEGKFFDITRRRRRKRPTNPGVTSERQGIEGARR